MLKLNSMLIYYLMDDNIIIVDRNWILSVIDAIYWTVFIDYKLISGIFV